ncbi:MAG TPA: hypothetical protein VNZ03_06690 [Terriglobales bacterium]|jgi:hypothetical protein|nr:hypothetical protein [Terriglobales bacterium]
MTYSKPEVVVVGNASAVIEIVSQKSGVPHDSTGNRLTGPAYDLDE